MIVYFVISFVAPIPFMFYFAQAATAETNGDAALMQTLLFSVAIALPIFLFLMRRDRKKQQKNAGIFIYKKTTITQYVMIAILGSVFCIGVNNLISFSQVMEFSPCYEEVSAMIYSSGIVLQLLVVGIVANVYSSVPY